MIIYAISQSFPIDNLHKVVGTLFYRLFLRSADKIQIVSDGRDYSEFGSHGFGHYQRSCNVHFLSNGQLLGKSKQFYEGGSRSTILLFE